MTSQPTTQFVDDYQQLFEQQLRTLFEKINDDSELIAAMQYACLNGGKRLRPLLVYATGLDFGCALESLHPSALAVEMIHCYSLIHDDLPAMDDDDFRRGQPSCHKKFNEAFAILAGDGLHALAFETLEQTPVNEAQQIALTQHLATACGYQGMVGGQALELECEQREITVKDLTKIHLRKTAALIRASIELGAICANVDSDTLHSLKEVGDTLGLAFQIQDDIFDFTEDQAANRPSFATLLGKARAITLCEQHYHHAKSQLSQVIGENSHLFSVINWLESRQD